MKDGNKQRLLQLCDSSSNRCCAAGVYPIYFGATCVRSNHGVCSRELGTNSYKQTHHNTGAWFNIMLDHCSIFHRGAWLALAEASLNCLIIGGIILWSRSFTPAASSLISSTSSPVNSLVREALIEGKTTENSYEKDGYAIKWTFVNDLELIFVVRFSSAVRYLLPGVLSSSSVGCLPTNVATYICGRLAFCR
jgi:hypothetical protein